MEIAHEYIKDSSQKSHDILDIIYHDKCVVNIHSGN